MGERGRTKSNKREKEAEQKKYKKIKARGGT